MEFVWDPKKAVQNYRKPGVSFSEAATVFGDWLGATVSDPDHSLDEARHITVGCSNQDRHLLVAHADGGKMTRIISARLLNERPMKRRERNTADELRPEYDMAQLLKGAAQGKYAARFRAGTNLVLVEPEILREFKTDQAVNEALRLVLALRKVGGAGRRASR